MRTITHPSGAVTTCTSMTVGATSGPTPPRRVLTEREAGDAYARELGYVREHLTALDGQGLADTQGAAQARGLLLRAETAWADGRHDDAARLAGRATDIAANTRRDA